MLIRRAICLKIIDANFFGRVHIPAWFSEERRHMASRAFGFAVKESLPLVSSRLVKTPVRGLGCGNGKLIEVQGSKFRGDQIRVIPLVARFCLCSDRKLA